MQRTWKGIVSLCIIALCGIGVADADVYNSASYQLIDPLISPSGFSSSAGFQLLGSIGEIAVGTSSASTFQTIGGFLTYPYASSPAVSITPGNGQITLSWTASQGFLGWNVSAYAVGQSTVSGGPYSFTAVGNAVALVQSGLTNGHAYYFVVTARDGMGNTLATSTEVSGTPTGTTSGSGGGAGGGGSGGGGGGGGGAGGGGFIGGSNASVHFTGRVYPDSTVTILKDGVIVGTTVAGQDASFSMTVGDLAGGAYLFSVYALDTKGIQSPTISIPITITSGVNTNVSGIFLAPTISLDKSQVKRGDPVTVFGQSVPSSSISISVNSKNELFFQTPTDKDGVYSYTFLSSPLELGSHSAHSNASDSGQVSHVSKSIAFTVGDTNIASTKPVATTGVCGTLRGDLNCDGKVNLVDFSIEAFWYKKQGFPAADDLNKDGNINIVDFSIMASHWTG